MKYRILNILAWMFVLFVIAAGVIKGGKVDDSRITIIHIGKSIPAGGSDTAGVIATDNPTGDQAQTSAADLPAEENQDTDDRDSASAEAVLLNDSAAILLGAGEFAAAETMLKQSLRVDSLYARAHYNLGLVYHKENRMKESIDEYTRAIAIRPYYYNPVYNLGLLYYDIADYERALVWFQKAVSIKKSTEAASGYYNMGLAYERLKDLKEAENAYKEALRLKPGFVEARYNLALLRMEDGRYREAVADLEKTAALGFKKRKLYTNIGICCAKLDRNEDAMRAYEEAVTVAPDDPQGWFNLALSRNRLGQGQKAIEAYHKALALDSAYSEASFNLAMLYADQGLSDSAISLYRQAIAQNPRYSKAYFNLGLLYGGKAQFDSAIACYSKIVELDPENIKAQFNLGLTYGQLDRLDDAERAYQGVLDQDPINEKALNNLGTVYLKLENYDSAYVCFNRLVGLTHGATAYFNRAKANNELGRTDKAMEDYRKAIETDPGYGKAYHNLALLEEETGNHQTAIELLQKAISNDSDNWKSHWKLGQIYRSMGLLDKARGEYTLAAAAKPDSKKFAKEYDELFNQR